jgi:DMSO reductase anchor subunit
MSRFQIWRRSDQWLLRYSFFLFLRSVYMRGCLLWEVIFIPIFRQCAMFVCVRRKEKKITFNNDILLVFKGTCFKQIHWSLSTDQQTNNYKQIQNTE